MGELGVGMKNLIWEDGRESVMRGLCVRNEEVVVGELCNEDMVVI